LKRSRTIKRKKVILKRGQFTLGNHWKVLCFRTEGSGGKEDVGVENIDVVLKMFEDTTSVQHEGREVAHCKFKNLWAPFLLIE